MPSDNVGKKKPSAWEAEGHQCLAFVDWLAAARQDVPDARLPIVATTGDGPDCKI